MYQEELKELLENQHVLTDLPDSKAVEAVQDLLKHPGLPLLWGLLMGSRQFFLLALSQHPLGNADQVTRAAVIQGKIQGIELFRDTVIEQGVPSRTDADKEQRK